MIGEDAQGQKLEQLANYAKSFGFNLKCYGNDI